MPCSPIIADPAPHKRYTHIGKLWGNSPSVVMFFSLTEPPLPTPVPKCTVSRRWFAVKVCDSFTRSNCTQRFFLGNRWRFLCGNDTVAVAMHFAMKNVKICFSLRKFLAILPAIQKIASDCGCDAVVHLAPHPDPAQHPKTRQKQPNGPYWTETDRIELDILQPLCVGDGGGVVGILGGGGCKGKRKSLTKCMYFQGVVQDFQTSRRLIEGGKRRFKWGWKGGLNRVKRGREISLRTKLEPPFGNHHKQTLGYILTHCVLFSCHPQRVKELHLECLLFFLCNGWRWPLHRISLRDLLSLSLHETYLTGPGSWSQKITLQRVIYAIISAGVCSTRLPFVVVPLFFSLCVFV